MPTPLKVRNSFELHRVRKRGQTTVYRVKRASSVNWEKGGSNARALTPENMEKINAGQTVEGTSLKIFANFGAKHREHLELPKGISRELFDRIIAQEKKGNVRTCFLFEKIFLEDKWIDLPHGTKEWLGKIGVKLTHGLSPEATELQERNPAEYERLINEINREKQQRAAGQLNTRQAKN